MPGNHCLSRLLCGAAYLTGFQEKKLLYRTFCRQLGTAVAVKSSLRQSVSFHHDGRSDNNSSRTDRLIPYCRSWAWQSWLLHQRLRCRRDEEAFLSKGEHDRDVILLLEHDHVYTLGRGANEKHLTFLQESGQDRECDLSRYRLSRTNRGPGSARLSVDSTFMNNLSNITKSDDSPAAVDHLSIWATTSFIPVMAPNGVPIYRVERGGECTYHGPGQLVVYPLLDLKQGHPLKDDLHWFLRVMEEVIIRTCASFGISNARRDEINTGVWVGERKVAAVGVAASRWITTHGFALNVDVNLDYFDTSIILPCGIEGRGVTSIARLLREQQGNDAAEVPTIQDVAGEVLAQMELVLEIQLESPRRLDE